MTLWQTEGLALDTAVLAFTVGEDAALDHALLPYDCLGSAAHAHGLARIGILSTAELEQLLAALRDAANGTLRIQPGDEDCHTALEAYLVQRTGAAGEKIHTGRSRNDQVIMALRLLVRDRLLGLADAIAPLFERLAQRADRYAKDLMPGFTHTRQAMLSTVGQWFGAYAEGLLRDVEGFLGPLAQANRSALGSAAGYGVPLPLNRALVADLLGLAESDANTLYTQNTRGRLEMSVVAALHGVALTLGRMASDLVWLSSEPFGFFVLPDALTTGSSIMPQKRNPDVFELLRALAPSLGARYVETASILQGLTAGYHRDLQRTKGLLLRSLDDGAAAVKIAAHAVAELNVDTARCRAALRPEILLTDVAYEHVRAGMPFREAYRLAKERGVPSCEVDPRGLLDQRAHWGAPGTLQADALGRAWTQLAARLEPYWSGHERALALLTP